jgi:hypothetical protein
MRMACGSRFQLGVAHPTTATTTPQPHHIRAIKERPGTKERRAAPQPPGCLAPGPLSTAGWSGPASGKDTRRVREPALYKAATCSLARPSAAGFLEVSPQQSSMFRTLIASQRVDQQRFCYCYCSCNSESTSSKLFVTELHEPATKQSWWFGEKTWPSMPTCEVTSSASGLA